MYFQVENHQRKTNIAHSIEQLSVGIRNNHDTTSFPSSILLQLVICFDDLVPYSLCHALCIQGNNNDNLHCAIRLTHVNLMTFTLYWVKFTEVTKYGKYFSIVLYTWNKQSYKLFSNFGLNQGNLHGVKSQPYRTYECRYVVRMFQVNSIQHISSSPLVNVWGCWIGLVKLRNSPSHVHSN
jgi:hypothetical protein